MGKSRHLDSLNETHPSQEMHFLVLVQAPNKYRVITILFCEFAEKLPPKKVIGTTCTIYRDEWQELAIWWTVSKTGWDDRGWKKFIAVISAKLWETFLDSPIIIQSFSLLDYLLSTPHSVPGWHSLCLILLSLETHFLQSLKHPVWLLQPTAGDLNESFCPTLLFRESNFELRSTRYRQRMLYGNLFVEWRPLKGQLIKRSSASTLCLFCFPCRNGWLGRRWCDTIIGVLIKF